MTSEKLLRTCDAWQRPVVGQGQKQLLAPKSRRPLLCAFSCLGSGDRSLAEGTQCMSPTSGPTCPVSQTSCLVGQGEPFPLELPKQETEGACLSGSP